MSEEITMQPRLYTGELEDASFTDEDRARVLRLMSLERSIHRRPETYLAAFRSLGDMATANSLELHDQQMLTRDASSAPSDRIKEFFTKRDDRGLEFDTESEKAIYDSVKTMERRKHPNAESARDEVRRYVFGEFLGRAVLWKTRQEETRKRPSAS